MALRNSADQRCRRPEVRAAPKERLAEFSQPDVHVDAAGEYLQFAEPVEVVERVRILDVNDVFDGQGEALRPDGVRVAADERSRIRQDLDAVRS
jgi:hypothetical protein